jgi:tellurite methyltransferase
MSKSTFIHQKRALRAPNTLLIESLHSTKKRGNCLDLGSGALYDARYLLSEGFVKVVSLDASKSYLRRATELSQKNTHFEFHNLALEEYPFPKRTFDMISAQFILPFLGPEKFPSIWDSIQASLKKGGIFSGQLFGNRDGWNTKDTQMIFFSKRALKKLFAGYEILQCYELEQDGSEAIGNKQHWHVFNFILKKL